MPKVCVFELPSAKGPGFANTLFLSAILTDFLPAVELQVH